tara:strand:+ start:3022 stop:3333 length:312 start_codon:yes stop_codon:yes gene_type:complete
MEGFVVLSFNEFFDATLLLKDTIFVPGFQLGVIIINRFRICFFFESFGRLAFSPGSIFQLCQVGIMSRHFKGVLSLHVFMALKAILKNKVRKTISKNLKIGSL